MHGCTCALPRVHVQGCPTLLAASWFGENERATANTIASVANPLGIAIGSVLSPILADDGKQMKTMMYVLSRLPVCTRGCVRVRVRVYVYVIYLIVCVMQSINGVVAMASMTRSGPQARHGNPCNAWCGAHSVCA